MKTAVKMTAAAGVLAAGLMGVGCSDGMSRHDVQVSLDPALTSTPMVSTFAVNLVGVNAAEESDWANAGMTQYWMPDSPMRKNSAAMTREFAFGPGNTAPKTLSKDDPIWEVWSKAGAQSLFILANLPGGHEDRPGDADDRRLILPLQKSRWESGQTIRIVVQRGSLRNETPPKPPKQ